MRSRAGFSMMEVAIAILVLAIAIPATLATVAYTMREAGVLIRESTAAMTAKTVLNQPGWGATFQPINGYEAKRTVTAVDLPASPDGSSSVRVDKVEVVLRANGHEVLSLTAYEKRRR